MKKTEHRRKSTLAGLLALALFAPGFAQGASFGGLTEWFDENLIDPEDGMLDASDYLTSAYGFFPVPIIVTEPAVGFGIGAAVAGELARRGARVVLAARRREKLEEELDAEKNLGFDPDEIRKLDPAFVTIFNTRNIPDDSAFGQRFRASCRVRKRAHSGQREQYRS